MVRTLGVLVAGGRGARLGLGIPKALLKVGGRTLIERALATLREVCDACVVAAPADMTLPIDLSIRVIDVPDRRGPIAGVLAGLFARTYERAIVLGVDFPLVRAATLEALLSQLPGYRAVVPAPGGIPQPLAAAYDDDAASLLSEAARSGPRITKAVLELDPLLLDDLALAEIPGGAACFFNLNTLSDRDYVEEKLRVDTTRGLE